ncbi:hypothetical protein [Kitasatospora sp. NPDC057541]|uniref:hypothetical protein n=1 Tax=unclassified Kitasatospora TaxID=2633591 RepID=UPI003679BA1D
MERTLANDLIRASQSIRSMDTEESDVSIVAHVAILCTGPTAADALQSATNWARQATTAEVHALAIARVPGPRPGASQVCLTLTVSYPDPETGEFTGETHHAAHPRLRTSNGTAG